VSVSQRRSRVRLGPEHVSRGRVRVSPRTWPFRSELLVNRRAAETDVFVERWPLKDLAIVVGVLVVVVVVVASGVLYWDATRDLPPSDW
jgi:hypothetical protein